MSDKMILFSKSSVDSSSNSITSSETRVFFFLLGEASLYWLCLFTCYWSAKNSFLPGSFLRPVSLAIYLFLLGCPICNAWVYSHTCLYSCDISYNKSSISDFIYLSFFFLMSIDKCLSFFFKNKPNSFAHYLEHFPRLCFVYFCSDGYYFLPLVIWGLVFSSSRSLRYDASLFTGSPAVLFS